MAGEAALRLGVVYKPDAATDPEMPVTTGGRIVAPKKEPDQWAINAKYVGLPGTIAIGILYGLYCFGSWFGPNVWVKWQDRFLGAEQAQTNLVEATGGLVKLIKGIDEKRNAEQDNAARTTAALVTISETLSTIERRIHSLEERK